MMVTNDVTALRAIRIDTKTGNPVRTKPAAVIDVIRPPPIRPKTTNSRTGKMIDPNAPIGSRRKILISSQVSFQSPRNIFCPFLVANRVACQFQKDVFQVGEDRPEVHDTDPILGEAVDHLGDKFLSPASNCELRIQ